MAERKSHLLYTKAPEGTATFRYGARAINNDDKPYYPEPAVESFRNSISSFNSEKKRREEEKNKNIAPPENIVCIEFEFHGFFNARDFEIRYRQDFGLSVIRYFDLNTKGIFGIVDEGLFDSFIKELEKFIICTNHEEPNYNVNIRFIKHFTFHTTESILKNFNSASETIHLQIIDNIELSEIKSRGLKIIESYLSQNEITYVSNPRANEIEITKSTEQNIIEIAKNFDIVYSINSNSYKVTKPSRFGTNIKEYPFSIDEPSDDLTVFGIIDTGVSIETPLSVLVVNNDNSFSLDDMNPRVDEAVGGDGHGTGVGAFVALGEQLSSTIKARLSPDAKILSIKVLNGDSGNISDTGLVSLIERANDELDVKYFTLTICYDKPIKKGEHPSDYTYLLDKIAFERDILIFICTGNYEANDNTIEKDYPQHFLKDELNICTPADSYNNIVVGAVGDNFEPELPITPLKYPISSNIHPAFYSRKFHLDYERMPKKSKLRKPDVIYSGGNLVIEKDEYGAFAEYQSEAALNYLSANSLEPILRGVGTSFSTPLVANLAAKILRRYPKLKPQTIKALIVNSSEKIKFDETFKGFQEYQKKYISGFGTPYVTQCLYSDDSSATIIIEDTIAEGTVKSLPIVIPDYLNSVEKNKGLLGVEATICFRFLPIQNNHLAYCPVNISFGIFKNVALEDHSQGQNAAGKNKTTRKGISGGSTAKIGVVKGWSQDAFYKSIILSNTHKERYTISKEDIMAEENIFKIAINCHFHKILPDYIMQSLPQAYEYSLVIRLWDNQSEKNRSDQLYTELQQLNELEILSSMDIEGDLEAEASL